MADIKEILAKASEKSSKEETQEQGAEKSPAFYFRSFKPVLNFNSGTHKINFREYAFFTKDKSLAEIIREKLVKQRNLAYEVSAKNFFFGSRKNSEQE